MDSMSFSMRATVYGIKKKFPSIKNISCQDLEERRKDNQKLTCLVCSNNNPHDV